MVSSFVEMEVVILLQDLEGIWYIFKQNCQIIDLEFFFNLLMIISSLFQMLIYQLKHFWIRSTQFMLKLIKILELDPFSTSCFSSLKAYDV